MRTIDNIMDTPAETLSSTEQAKIILQRLSMLIGRNVRTPDGTGLLIGVQMECNGLYLRPETVQCRVWFIESSDVSVPRLLWAEYSPEQLEAAL